MKLDTIVLANPLLGMENSDGFITVVSVICALVSATILLLNYVRFYKYDKRIKRAKAHKEEAEADTASLDYIKKVKNELQKDLEKRIQDLEERVRVLEGEKVDHLSIIHRYKESGKEAHTCIWNTEEHPCPAITKFNELKQ